MTEQKQPETASKLTKQNFVDWLTAGGQPMTIQSERGKFLLFCIPKNETVDYVYYQNLYSSSDSPQRGSMAYCCLYDKQNDLICGDDHLISSLYKLGLEAYTTEGELRNRLTRQVVDLVEATVADDPANLEIQEIACDAEKEAIDYYLKYGAQEDAYHRLFATEEPEIRYRCEYQAGEWRENDLLAYLKNQDAYVKQQAENYLAANQEKILCELLKDEALRKAYTELMEDTKNPLHCMKMISDAVRESEAKRVKVTIVKDGLECTFNAKAEALKGYHKYYSSVCILGDDRKKFESRFGEYSRFDAGDITNISCGRKTLYEAPQPELEQTSDPIMGDMSF